MVLLCSIMTVRMYFANRNPRHQWIKLFKNTCPFIGNQKTGKVISISVPWSPILITRVLFLIVMPWDVWLILDTRRLNVWKVGLGTFELDVCHLNFGYSLSQAFFSMVYQKNTNFIRFVRTRVLMSKIWGVKGEEDDITTATSKPPIFNVYSLWMWSAAEGCEQRQIGTHRHTRWDKRW